MAPTAQKGRARRILGDLKWRLVDRWPYAILKPFANRRRERYRRQLDRLPPIRSSDAPVDLEVHMFCGKEHIDMGIWASWSVMRFFENPVLYVHSDGTLGDAEFEQWRGIVPGAVLVSSSEADEKFAAELAGDFPTLSRWRDGYWSARQVIDFHLFGDAHSFLGLDSDVLCFRRPREVEEHLREHRPGFRWNRDLHDFYSADRALLESVAGLAIPAAFNCGFLLSPRLTRDDFAFLDETLEALDSASIDVFHWAMGQTLYAICAARDADSAPLPSTYDVRFGRGPSELVARHYVGLWNVRPKYFLEGVPRLVSELENGSARARARSA
jgi:hypothetical protein